MSLSLAEIPIRDPFVFPDADGGVYYLFGTTDPNPWDGPGVGFDCYRSRDLKLWKGPFPAFRPPLDFWATKQFWAPEVHRFGGRYYMFASFKSPDRTRGTQILAADRPEGPYALWSDGPVTPADWECLDGTLHVDGQGAPWSVFCHEWLQVHDGTICAERLSSDLREALGEPILLFHASSAPWVREMDGVTPAAGKPMNYVTDGPFLFRLAGGSLLMLWSSTGAEGYAVGIARSSSGNLLGPWVHELEPLWKKDGGHGMIFRTFAGELFLSLHQPNESPKERAVFLPLVEAIEAHSLKILSS